MKNDYDAVEGETFDEMYQSDGLRWMSILVVLLVVGGFFGLAWYAWNTSMGEAMEEGELLVVEADGSPYREKPENPGGMEFPHQDKEVYNNLMSGKGEEATVESLLPEPEEPAVERQMSAPQEEDTQSWINKKLHPEAAAQGAEQVVKEQVTEKVAPKAEVPKADPVPVETPKAEVQEEIKKDVPHPETVAQEEGIPAYTPPKPVVKPWIPEKRTEAVIAETPAAPAPEEKAEPAPVITDAIVAQAEKYAAEKAPVPAPVVVPPAAAPTVSAPAPVAASGVAIQLAALRSRQEAETTWKRVSAKHGDLLASRTQRIVVADIPGKGTYYRLRVGVNSPADGTTICNELQRRGQACIVVR